jgi:hypothetical protein
LERIQIKMFALSASDFFSASAKIESGMLNRRIEIDQGRACTPKSTEISEPPVFSTSQHFCPSWRSALSGPRCRYRVWQRLNHHQPKNGLTFHGPLDAQKKLI